MIDSLKHALVVGMGVAGLAIARLLAKDGWKITLVERSATLRTGGQPVDVRGPALEVMSHMGLLDDLRSMRTQILGMSIVDSDGREIERNTEWTVSTGELKSQDVEVLREDLINLLRRNINEQVEQVFGDSVKKIIQSEDGIIVNFEKSNSRKFDVVIGADGFYSKVRSLVFGPQDRYQKHLGKYLSVFTSPNILNLDRWQVWYRSDDSNFLSFPILKNSAMRTAFWFNNTDVNLDAKPIDDQKKITAEHMKNIGGSLPLLLQEMWSSEDFYCTQIAQIHIGEYSSGRVVLLGDSGYCASPFSGQGTSLALIGAYILAAELRSNLDYPTAFKNYETRMRPFVELNQAIAKLDQSDADYLAAFDKAKSSITL